MTSSTHFVLDVETLGVESTSIILSAGMIRFDATKDFTAQELIDDSVYVRFDLPEQQAMGRYTDPNTMKWWKSQDQAVYQEAVGSKGREPCKSALQKLCDYYDSAGDQWAPVWIRGTLDQMVLDSLSNMLGVRKIANYSVYRDVRTAIELLYNAPSGYTNISVGMPLLPKHQPVNDCVIDAMMLKYGVSND